MVATARDLAAYGEALRDGRLLSPPSMAIFTDWFPINERLGVGHNFFRLARPGEPVLIEHTGSVLGFTGSALLGRGDRRGGGGSEQRRYHACGPEPGLGAERGAG